MKHLDFILTALGMADAAESISTAAFTSSTRSIRHENTLTTKAVREIERRIATDLKRFARKIRSEFGGNVAEARQRYGAAVLATIQSAVQSSYIEGTAYVERFAGQPASLTNSDLQVIRQQAQFFADRFWADMDRAAREDLIEPERHMPDRGTVMGLLATSLSFTLLNESTMQKAQQLQGEPELVWITELDFKVCPICRPIHGRTWRVGDPLILHPPRDSHPNCRCRLLLKEGGRIFSS